MKVAYLTAGIAVGIMAAMGLFLLLLYLFGWAFVAVFLGFVFLAVIVCVSYYIALDILD